MKAKETLEKFLQAWIQEDYEEMLELCQITWREGSPKPRTKNSIKAIYSVPKLKEYQIISSTYVSPASMIFSVELTMARGNKLISAANVICESEAYKPVPYGKWGVNPISVLNVVQGIPAPGKKEAEKPEADASSE